MQPQTRETVLQWMECGAYGGCNAYQIMTNTDTKTYWGKQAAEFVQRQEVGKMMFVKPLTLSIA